MPFLNKKCEDGLKDDNNDLSELTNLSALTLENTINNLCGLINIVISQI